MERIRVVLHSRALRVVGVVLAVAVPVVTLSRLPSVSPWPVVLGLVPWIVGKYVLCPLRWRALTNADLGRWWHVRAYAESEIFGLLTPGHVGSDLWRVRRLTGADVGKGDALASVAADRLVGALGLTVFVLLAGSALPLHLLVGALGTGVVALGVMLVVRRARPGLLSLGPLPPPRRIAQGLVLSMGYQATIALLLFGTLRATGHTLSPLELMGAFGASQVAAAVPGPHGASPRDAALVLALVALGVPLAAAAAAVSLKATLAWLPALVLGGVSLVVTRRVLRGAVTSRSGQGGWA
ncbi:lysylphosphatidylglycerol synthase domain-containing protein [Aeromicrobium stalagmiti]|uniref:lysylphosphatidylglycerol synthase domain-containing protein n=1 Tax=Aeromicrobium stalagmiti TaxID=2738988 RepID=UPI001569B374|nr:lysylphosphatidylglycerol synthase domain-containing protein [Aeromicrobium stalagmiti]NRQ51425.1 flippase-like domain-containing protein [Aeromicrobium stalagmiti]